MPTGTYDRGGTLKRIDYNSIARLKCEAGCFHRLARAQQKCGREAVSAEGVQISSSRVEFRTNAQIIVVQRECRMHSLIAIASGHDVTIRPTERGCTTYVIQRTDVFYGGALQSAGLAVWQYARL
jgi:ribosomal protein L27